MNTVLGHFYDNAFKEDTPNGSGKSFDFSNDVYAKVSTGGTEDIFDGGTNFSISMWVKGWPSAGNSLINKNQFDPAKYGDLRAWFAATEPSSFSTSNVVGGPTPSNGDTSKIWHDLSGNGHHAVLTLDPAPTALLLLREIPLESMEQA